jgi:hypothetical protein
MDEAKSRSAVSGAGSCPPHRSLARRVRTADANRDLRHATSCHAFASIFTPMRTCGERRKALDAVS